MFYDVTSDTTCELTSCCCNIEFGSEETLYISVPEWTEIEGKQYQVTALADECFYERDVVNADILEGVELPDSITTIGDYCFTGSGIDSIDIPAGVTSLGNGCFSGCSELSFVNLPDALTSLGDECFSDCMSLESVTMPESVKFIGDDVFKDSNMRYVKKEGTRLHFFSNYGDDAMSTNEWLREYYRKRELNKYVVEAIVEKLKEGNQASEHLLISNVGTDCCELSLVEKGSEEKGKTLWKAVYSTAELESKTEEVKAAIAKAYAEVKKG